VCIHSFEDEHSFIPRDVVFHAVNTFKHSRFDSLLFGTGLNWRESGFYAFFWRWVGRSAHITYLTM